MIASGYKGPLAMIENTLEFPADAASPAELSDLRARLDLGGGPVVMYTGTLEAYQRLDLLLDAAVRVREQIAGVRFVVVGGTPAQIEELRRMASSRGVAGEFRFVEAVRPAEVPRFHQLADVLVTTRARGTNVPLKIYQYLRSDRPIVATAIPSHTQVLEPGTAELVMPELEAIAAGIVHVLTDRGYARRLAEGAALLARQRYGEEVYLERLRTLLAQMPPSRQRNQSMHRAHQAGR